MRLGRRRRTWRTDISQKQAGEAEEAKEAKVARREQLAKAKANYDTANIRIRLASAELAKT